MNPQSSDSTLSEAEIIRIVQAYYDGVDSRDPDKLAGLYSSAPSTSLAFNADAPIVGRAAIRDFCARFFQAVTIKHTRIEIWTHALMGQVVPREMPLGRSAATLTVVSTALPTFTIDNAAGATKLALPREERDDELFSCCPSAHDVSATRPGPPGWVKSSWPRWVRDDTGYGEPVLRGDGRRGHREGHFEAGGRDLKGPTPLEEVLRGLLGT